MEIVPAQHSSDRIAKERAVLTTPWLCSCVHHRSREGSVAGRVRPAASEQAWQTPTASSTCELSVKPSVRASWVSASLELALEVVGEMHVGHGTAHLAREVVMVPDERLGELEAGELADAGQATDDALGLEHGEVAVDAARALAGRAPRSRRR